MTHEASVSFVTDDRALYEWLVGYAGRPAASLTVRQTIVADPNLRRPRGLRALARQMWDVLVWEYRKAAGLSLPDDRVLTIEVPSVNFTAEHLG